MFKGSDNWLASEFLLPLEVLAPLAQVTDDAVVLTAWPHQILLNMHPELGKTSGGFRTIAKTPKQYRLWARSRRAPILEWENTLCKPYDTACKGSSALIAAADRSMCAEIAVRDNKHVCGSFFDLQKFVDSVSPQALYESVCEKQLPHA